MAIYESLEYLFCYNEEKTETSKLRKLVTRAHRLARNALGSDTDNRNNISESTGLLTEEIPMQMLSSEGQGSRLENPRSENTRSYRSNADESHHGASSVSGHEETLGNSIEVEAETSLDTALLVQCHTDSSKSSGQCEKSRTSSIVDRVINAIFPKKKSLKYIPLETCDNSDSEETVIFQQNNDPVVVNTNSEQVPADIDSSVENQASSSIFQSSG